ncbi:hypothetical protein [Arthrobacter sp. CG_A4]|uniref:hypothetical protein n=1 Tax=Arthrobacter sp. CG_A4 TaxID=3071706 RepID=UPI002DF8190A|nr:hypothetical protein [Arthrobacter sp. CG_A4]
MVLAAAWGAGIALFVSWGRPLDETLVSAAVWAFYAAVLWYVQARSERRTAAKLDAQDGVLVYLRYPDSRAGSLSGIWNMGVVTFDGTAGMNFQPAVYDTLEPTGRPTAFTALVAVSAGPRKIDRKEQKYLTHPGFLAIRLTTDKGDIEVAARPESLRRILGAVTGSPEAK